MLSINKFIALLLLSLTSSISIAAIDITLDIEGDGHSVATTSSRVFIERVELSFPNKRASQTVPFKSKKLYATARFKYLGNGPLTIRWLVDNIIVAQTTENLVFGKEVEVRSDKYSVYLPTFEPGRHAVSVQFRNSHGVVAIDVPQINYFVADGVDDFNLDGTLTTLFPKARSVEVGNFYFRWQGVSGISSYLLEVERVATKFSSADGVIKAITKSDLFSPTNAQREQLSAGLYRWRVTGMFSDKKQSPLISEWASFDVENNASSTNNLYISQLTVQASHDKPAVLASADNRLSDVYDPASGPLIARGVVAAGAAYSLNVELNNTGLLDKNNLQVEVKRAGELLGYYPVTSKAGENSYISIPLQAGISANDFIDTLAVMVLEGGVVIDQAALNLKVEAQLLLGNVDFNAISGNATSSRPIAGASICNGDEMLHHLASSRMVAAISDDSALPAQSLLEKGFFSFDAQQNVQFKAYFKDQGLGEELKNIGLSRRDKCRISSLSPDDRFTLVNNQEVARHRLENCLESVGNCPAEQTLYDDLSRKLYRDDAIKGMVYQLEFLAYPVDKWGQISGDAIVIGPVDIRKIADQPFEGFVTSPPWQAPDSGQYEITLNDISQPADFYATNPGGYPKYLHAAGFDLDITGIDSVSSTFTHTNQATIKGIATAKWRNNTRLTTLPFSLNNIQVELSDPLHARLISGEIKLTQNANTLNLLQLQGSTFQLKDLNISISGAKADLAYALPEGYSRQQTDVNIPQYKKGDMTVSPLFAQEQIQASAAVLVEFDDVNVVNGGEFITRYFFDNSWADIALNNEELALRLMGGSLVVDTSTHASYSDYTMDASYTGIGFHDVLLRVKVNAQNHLFSVTNGQQAYIHGKAKWLTFNGLQVSGEDIQVIPSAQVAPFFDEPVADVLNLLSPFGFNLKISGGAFGLEQSIVGGVNFSGSVQLAENSAVTSSQPFAFNDLTRRTSATGQYLFSTPALVAQNLTFEVDHFSYEPETIQLLIGEEDRGGNPAHALNNHFDLAAENISNARFTGTWQETIQSTLEERSGLLISNGHLSKGWHVIEGTALTQRGSFILNANGLLGQWLEFGAAARFEINSFDTAITRLWLNFSDSALINSSAMGHLNIPYPVDQKFLFSNASIDQEGLLQIPSDGLSFDESRKLELSYWHAELRSPISNDASSIILNRENQRIQLAEMELSLLVDDENLGGTEFTMLGGDSAPFIINTEILPDGQLANTQVREGSGTLYFVGQKFEANTIKFAPYFSFSTTSDETEKPATMQPLVDVTGNVTFNLFGTRNIKVQHTALGAQVPDIVNADAGNFGEGAIKTNVQFNFVNTYARNAELMAEQIQATQTSEASQQLADANIALPEQPLPFKAFVGMADLIIMNAVSIRGLAEAGIHKSQRLTSPGRWEDTASSPEKSYERIGLGLGADIVKATIAGLRGIETATKLGGAVVSAVAGVDGTGEQVVKLGTEAATFIQSVAIAAAVTSATGGVAADEIRHAIDNGLSTTNSGIELLKLICAEQPNQKCTEVESEALLLDISSLLVRVAGAATHFEELADNPQELASISLQTLDIGIPLLMGFSLDDAYALTGGPALTLPDGQVVTLDDKKNAGLSVAHVIVSASRSLVDHEMTIPMNDFFKISQLTVDAARSLKQVQGVNQSLATLPAGTDLSSLMELSFDLADASIKLAKDITNDGGAEQLAGLASQYVNLLCQHSDKLAPLFPEEFSAEAIKQPLALSSAVLQQVTGSLPQNPTAAVAQLKTLLETLGRENAQLQGCGEQITLPGVVRAMFKIAAHSLQPMDGSLDNFAQQTAWTLEGVDISISVLSDIAQQIPNLVVPDEINKIQDALQELIPEFESIGSQLSNQSAAADDISILLQLAENIPIAMRDFIEQRGSRDAAELLDLHIVLMQQLQPLLAHKDEISNGNFSNIDPFTLPVALIDELQDLSLFNQCQRYGLSNLAITLSMAQELSKTTPRLTVVMGKLNTLYQNIKACDSTGLTQSRELEQLMALLELMAGLAEGSSSAQHIVFDALPQLLPLFITQGEQMLNTVSALTTALPIVDFSQDNLSEVLDDTLIKLLNEAYLQSDSVAVQQAIAKARSIIRHADFSVMGVTVVRNEAGDAITIEHHHEDGRYRVVDLLGGRAKQSYPEQYPGYEGGLKEELINVGATFESLPIEDQQSLFTDSWNTRFSGGDVMIREYRELINGKAASNIAIVDMSDFVMVKITDSVSYGTYTLFKLFTIDEMPVGLLSAELLSDDDLIIQTLAASLHVDYSPGNNQCPFTSGCMYQFESGRPILNVRSATNPHEIAQYLQSDGDIGYSNFSDIKITGELFFYRGYLSANSGNWHSDWHVEYAKNTWLVLKKDQSVESFFLDGISDAIDHPSEIPTLLTEDLSFINRQVINEGDVWDYRPTENQAIHTSANGRWEVYSMPSDLSGDVTMPAPDVMLPMSLLELQFKGDTNGLISDETLPGVPANLWVDGDIQLPTGNANDVITISLQGDTSTISQGGLPLGTEALTAGSSVTTTADGSYVVTNADGSKKQHVNSDNLKITRQESVDGQRTTTIEFCADYDQSLANCSASRKELFSTTYNLFDNYEILYLPTTRPVITPASGVNQAIKHQLWLDIFELERQLRIEPNESLLTQLHSLIIAAETAGLSVDELTEQHRYIAGQAINQLIMLQLEHHDEGVTNIAQINAWEANPSESPMHKINLLIEQGKSIGLAVSIHAHDFKKYYFEALVLSYRASMHQLQQVDIGTVGDENLLNALSGAITIFIDSGASIYEINPQFQLDTEEYVCPILDAIDTGVVQPLINSDENRVILPMDLQFLMAMEALGYHSGCANDNMADITALSHRLAVDVDVKTLRFQTAAMLFEEKILRQNPVIDNFNGGVFNSQDLIDYYLAAVFIADSLNELAPPAMVDYPVWLKQVQVLDRLIQLINSEQQRRTAAGENTYFTAVPVRAFQTSIIDKIVLSWETEWNRLLAEFIDGSTKDVEQFKALAKHFDLIGNINARLAAMRPDGAIKIDSATYLSLNLGSGFHSPLDDITQQQMVFVNQLWSASTEINRQQAKQNLNEQDAVIQFLLNTFPVEILNSLQLSSQQHIAYVSEQLNDVSTALDAASTADEIDTAVEPITELRIALEHLQFSEVLDFLQLRIQGLLDQAVLRVRDSPDALSLEFKKILAIYQTKSQGVAINVDENPALLDAIHEAGVGQLYIIASGGDLDDIRDFISLLEFQNQLAIADPEWSFTDILPHLEGMHERAEDDLITTDDYNADLAKARDFLELAAALSAMGIEEVNIAEVLHFLAPHLQQASGCIVSNNCTITHVRLYLEIAAQLAALGSEDGSIAATVDEMIDSSPVTMPRSMRSDSELPDFRAIVLADKTGHTGRHAAAAALENLANRIPVTDAAGRMAVNSVVARLESLAALVLPYGHIKPIATSDPLLLAAENLTEKIVAAQLLVQEQLAVALAETPGVLATEQANELFAELGTTEEELSEILLPEANGVMGEGRIDPGNKYHLAAEALEMVAELDNAMSGNAWLSLSYRLLSELPEPNITTEADYRVDAISQLALYVLERSGEVVTASEIKNHLVGGLLETLLSLPAEQRPAASLLAFAKTELLSNLLPDDGDSCGQLYPCLMLTGLDLTATLLDSTLSEAQSQESDLTPQQKAIKLIKQMSADLKNLPNKDNNPLLTWVGLGAESISLVFDFAKDGINDKTILLSGLTLSNRLLQSSEVSALVGSIGQNAPAIPMAYNLVVGSSDLLIKQLGASQARRLPIAFAQLAQQSLLTTFSQLGIDPQLITAATVLGDWQLNFADKDTNWNLITNGTAEADKWLDALLASGGIAKLNADLNASGLLGDVKVPAALALSPFIAARSLLVDEALLLKPNSDHLILADLAANLSNSWFLAANYTGGVTVPSTVDHPPAIVLRALKEIKSGDSSRLKALKLVGKVGINSLQALLPGATISKVMSIAWNGGGDGDEKSANISQALLMGINGVSDADFLQFVVDVPATASEILAAISSGDDASAKLLRIVSLTTTEEDLLPPDSALNNPLFNSTLTALGEVRKISVSLSDQQHNSHLTLGYLQTVPFIEMNNGVPTLSSEAAFASDMQEMVDLALNYQTTGEALTKVLLGSVDIARLGVSALAPLMKGDKSGGVAADIQQRSVFNGLVEGEDSAGFSGVSGGLQIERDPVTLEQDNFMLEMYGQLQFPLIGKQVGLMQYIDDNNLGQYLFFEGASEPDVLGEFVGGLSGGIKAEFRVANDSLSMAYWGKTKLEILSNTIADVSVAGVIDQFPNPALATTPEAYVTQLINDTGLAQCGQLTGQILPFPLSLSGVSGTATVGGFIEKNPGLSFSAGTRVGLAGSLKVPGANSLFGLTLSGNATSAISGSLNVTGNNAGGQVDDCLAPELTLTLLGQELPLTGFDMQSQSFIEMNSGVATTGIKFKVSLNSKVIDSILESDACPSFDPVAMAMCTTLGVMGKGTVWVVIRGEASGVSSNAEIILGIGKFPSANRPAEFPFFRFAINSEGNLTLPSIPLDATAGGWGGWRPPSPNFQDLCGRDLCEINDFGAEPVAPQ